VSLQKGCVDAQKELCIHAQETYKRDVQSFQDFTEELVFVVFTEELCTFYRRTVLMHKKSLVFMHKRPTNETYKTDVQKRGTKETYTRDQQKRLVLMHKRRTKEIYKRDVQKRPTKETYKRDLYSYTKDLKKRRTKETYKRDLYKRPTKETCIHAQETYKRIVLKCSTFYRQFFLQHVTDSFIFWL